MQNSFRKIFIYTVLYEYFEKYELNFSCIGDELITFEREMLKVQLFWLTNVQLLPSFVIKNKIK
jgi:hypothetical protein